MAFVRNDYSHSEPPAEETWAKAGCANAAEYRDYLNWLLWRGELSPFNDNKFEPER